MIPAIVLLGAFVNLLSTFTYIRSTLAGKTKPNRVTFFMWSVAPMIGTAAGYAEGVSVWTLVPVFLSGFAPFLNLCASFVNPNSYWKLTPFDYICGALSALALLLWWLSGDPIIAIIFAILSDAAAAVPTVLKAWKYPETEHFGAYLGSTFSAMTAFISTPVYSFASLAFPIYLIGCNIAVLSGIYRKKFPLFR